MGKSTIQGRETDKEEEKAGNLYQRSRYTNSDGY